MSLCLPTTSRVPWLTWKCAGVGAHSRQAWLIELGQVRILLLARDGV